MNQRQAKIVALGIALGQVQAFLDSEGGYDEDPKVRRELERIRDELALKKEHLPKMYASLDEEIP